MWEKYRQQAGEKRKDAQEEVAGLDGRLREINSELSEGPARKARLAELESDLDHLSSARKAKLESVDNLRRLTNALAEQRKQVETLSQILTNEKDKQARLAKLVGDRQIEWKMYQEKLERAAEIEANYQAWQTARQTAEHWEAIATQFRQQQERRQGPLMTIEAERGRLNQERQTLAGQEKNVNEIQNQISGLTGRLETTRQAIQTATGQLARRDEVLIEKDLHLSAQAQAKAENPRLKSEMEELKERIDTLESTTSPVCPMCGQPLSIEHRQELLIDLKNQGRQLGERYRENLAVLKKFETNQREMDKELATLSNAEVELRQQNRMADQISDQLKGIDQLSQDWLERGKPRLEEITRQIQENDFAIDAQAQLTLIDAELKAIGYDAQAHDQARQDELKGRDAEAGLRELENARATLAPLERELDNLKEQLAVQEKETKQHEIAYQQAEGAYAQAAENVPDFNQAERELFDIQEKENRLRMEVGAANQKVSVLAIQLARQKSLGGSAKRSHG